MQREMFSDHRMFMFLYALTEMAASVSNIIRITQITYEFVSNTQINWTARFYRENTVEPR